MPDPTQRLPSNVSGSFYVDSNCIDCDLCRNSAPEIFARDDDLGLSIVHRQPATETEIQLARDAIADCPADSIGEDVSKR